MFCYQKNGERCTGRKESTDVFNSGDWRVQRPTKVKGAGSLNKKEVNITSSAVNRYKNIKTDLVLMFLTIGVRYSSCRRAVG